MDYNYCRYFQWWVSKNWSGWVIEHTSIYHGVGMVLQIINPPWVGLVWVWGGSGPSQGSCSNWQTNGPHLTWTKYRKEGKKWLSHDNGWPIFGPCRAGPASVLCRKIKLVWFGLWIGQISLWSHNSNSWF